MCVCVCPFLANKTYMIKHPLNQEKSQTDHKSANESQLFMNRNILVSTPDNKY